MYIIDPFIPEIIFFTAVFLFFIADFCVLLLYIQKNPTEKIPVGAKNYDFGFFTYILP